jgi:phage regulator Rha-like protein
MSVHDYTGDRGRQIIEELFCKFDCMRRKTKAINSYNGRREMTFSLVVNIRC